ncbi:FHA domain-containing protein [Brasilonema octagenarum]|uniref:Peptide-binding protein n=1 Tax=Brasilonema octagenarum UFV-OR1 TaxID=417115 RepID=A0ABX1M9H8_9CYAN|nr:FHA domain-containing protein [Brasilonema octagenarum]NMF64078.1 peptide-binding protein [Brasilonema octagenarum UFV-OR1]
MIVCPNCNHPNPDGAVQCEACYTPLPATSNCPSCGANVQTDAAFCGQCGYNLRAAIPTAASAPNVPPLVNPEPLQPQPISVNGADYTPPNSAPIPPTAVAFDESLETTQSSPPPPTITTPPPQPVFSEPPSIPTPPPQEQVSAPPTPPPEPTPTTAQTPPPTVVTSSVSRTQLQQEMAKLIHVQTDRIIELPQNLSVVHMGKPNDRIPPDIDVSGFPNSEIVSRIHADIRLEGGAHYIEDVGSSNGTYINNLALLPGNRHRLRPGDRISLGKGDLVTFLFQIS